MDKTYIAIDLKSFYASVECVARGLDPMTTNLVVADLSRTEKTICLAVAPSLKAHGIAGRARLFEVVQRVAEVNALRRSLIPSREFSGKSSDDRELKANPALELDYIVAPPRMAHYMEFSSAVYAIYLQFFAQEDIHVYSIDEVFIDATAYLKLYKLTARELTVKIINRILMKTGVTATAGIGTNLYLCKVAMDIVAKHVKPDRAGVRIAELDEMRYRQLLWDHRPLTDFWRVGSGTARKLENNGMYTMGDVARRSLIPPGNPFGEDLLYKLFGINAELLIDHAWGYEPCTMAHIKAYKPTSNSVSSGQVLSEPYPADKAKLVTREMADALSLDLLQKGLVTNQLTLTVGYDAQSLTGTGESYTGPVSVDYYGRKVPKHANGTANLPRKTASTRMITQAVMEIFDRVVNPYLLVRRLNISALVYREGEQDAQSQFVQLDLFGNEQAKAEEDALLEREKKRQQAVLSIKKKYGKNAILKGMNLEEGATARDRNRQIGGHKA